MNLDKKQKTIVLLLGILFVIATIPSVTFSMMVLLEGFDPLYFVLAIISDTLFVFIAILFFKSSKGYKVRYLFDIKGFNSKFKESQKRFSKASEDFIKEYRKYSKEQYQKTGSLFLIPSVEETKWLYSSEDERKGLFEICLLLKTCIDNETYLVGFNKTVIKLHDDMYHILMVILYSKLPIELKYLLLELYNVSGFNLENNGLDDNYTLYIDDVTLRVEKELNPLVEEFKDDIDEYLNILSGKKTVVC